MSDVFTSEVLQRALEMKEQGLSWNRISARLGVSDEGLKRRLVPGFATRRQALIRQARYDREMGRGGEHVRHIPPAEVLAVLRTVPSDTRPVLARLMGDPLPGRSALDLKKRSNLNGPLVDKQLVVDRGKRASHLVDRPSIEKAV